MPQYELNLRDYIRIFQKRKYTIILVFVLVTLATIIFLPKQSITYTASTTIKIEERKTIAGLLTEWIVYSPGDVMESEGRFITSFPVMIRVGVEKGLIQESWFEDPKDKAVDFKNRDLGPENIRPEYVEDANMIVVSLQEKVKTEILTNTNMIKITATSSVPKEAMDLANIVAKSYIAENLKSKNKQVRHAREFIEEQVRELERNIKDAEERLNKFGDDSNKVKLAGPMEEKLTDLQFKLVEMRQKYTDKHPQIIQIRDQIRSMEAQVQGLSERQMEYARLHREVEINRKLYAMLKEKLEEARISEREKVSDVTIVDPAVMPGNPITTDNRIKVVIGAFMGLILGIAFAFIFETLDTSIGTIEDVENVIKLSVLGIVPPIESELGRSNWFINRIKNRFSPKNRSDSEERLVHLFAHYQPHSPNTEAYRNIHTNLKLSPGRKTILVTSSGPREGKTSVVSNLGIVMAQIGLKTLLVSTDLRRPLLEKVFGIKREPGLNELVSGTMPLDSVLNNITNIMLGDIGFEDIRKTPGIENIWILPSGHLPSNPVEVLESKAFAAIIEILKSRFDVIIFDSPPVLPVTDANLLAPKVDSVVLVYEIGRTSREGLMRAKVQLESVGAKISGVVLNHTQMQTEAISPYPYYNKYKYYGREVPKANRDPEVKKKT
ncbi:MAG: polysaccharide biosynthesis tyrosine autokinase [Candidatus Omnitrophica bacterium]|jgi:capsular exopolysaccharide synthesis family protein|nr:polysaccharide biosynthesis tyrosine autokinase [Candidatus Omnitrophota bacterium]MDD5078713.1 polysaccharide biosynthesis tyrosine autokinase [Candidatus Omnitrophota bacterium]MDD5080254.1 polysaccharide biosynthesis tyrosine autokinase [Candidatus Omnitrophota bacterium]